MDGIGWHPTQRVLAPVFKNKRVGMVDLVIWHWMRFLNQVLGYWIYLLGIATFIACQYLGFCLFRKLMKQWVIL